MSRLYRALLYLYPPGFRHAHGREMALHVRTLESLKLSRRQIALELLIDLVRSVPREWRTALSGRDPVLPSPRRSGDPMKNLLGDVRFAIRLLARDPGFALAAIATLALGIGANTAMFSLADATLLRPVSVTAPEELRVWSWSSSHPDFREYQQRTDVFSGVAGASGARMNIEAEGTSELRSAAFVSGNVFSVLGVTAALGRPLQPSDDTGPGGPVAGVLAHDYWQTRFAGDPAIVGKAIRVNGAPVTIVGVMAKGFRGTSLFSRPVLFLPLTSITQIQTGFFSRPAVLEYRGLVWLTVIGRLKAGVTEAQAADQMTAHYRRLHPPSRPDGETEKLRLIPLTDNALGVESGPSLRRFVLLLSGVVGLTLLIGCANLANLLLARASARTREFAVRLALGASRGCLLRQLMVETLALSLVGGAAGVYVAYLILGMLSAYQLPGGVSIANLALGIDRTAVAAAATLSLVTGLLFGSLPAWRATRGDLHLGMRKGGRSSSNARLRSALVAAQVALSLVLLAGAGLFLRSLVHAMDRPLGFEVDGVAAASVNPGLARYDRPRAVAFYEAALQRVESVPGVVAAAWTNILPTKGDMTASAETIDGYEKREGEVIQLHTPHVGPGFFRAAGIRLIAGRSFETTDPLTGPGITIVNRAAAEKYWPGGNAVGGRIMLSQKTGWMTVIGVCENTVISEIGERPEPLAYFQLGRELGGLATMTDPHHLLVRTSGDEQQLLLLIREQLKAIDPAVPSYAVRPFAEHVRDLVMPQRLGLTLFAVFGLLAVSLATVGIYGVASYVSSTRTREMAIRMALGASAANVRRLILLQGAGPIAAGIVLGLALGLWGARLAAGFLYDVAPTDPPTFLAVTALLGLLALAASYVPARRAASRQPAAALRND